MLTAFAATVKATIVTTIMPLTIALSNMIYVLCEIKARTLPHIKMPMIEDNDNGYYNRPRHYCQ
jgi:hypothetical protein